MFLKNICLSWRFKFLFFNALSSKLDLYREFSYTHDFMPKGESPAGSVDTEITQADLQYAMKYFSLTCQIFHNMLCWEHLKRLNHLTFSHHEHAQLIMMLFLKRFIADCSSFSRMKELRWVCLLVKLSLLQEWDQHSLLLWQNISTFWQPPRDGVCISSHLFTVRLHESISCFSR